MNTLTLTDLRRIVATLKEKEASNPVFHTVKGEGYANLMTSLDPSGRKWKDGDRFFIAIGHDQV